MAFSGNLATMPAADLLQWASNGKQTGTVQVSRRDTTKKIYIRKGVIVSCTSSDPREFLGHFLVSQGAIDESDLQGACIDQERQSGMLGQLLVQRGAITRERLDRMLRQKAEEAIFELFTWTSGRFWFLEGDLPDYELVPISLGVQGLVLEGMRRLDEWERIKEVFPSPLCVPVAVRPLLDEGRDIDPGRRSVLESVDDDRSIEDICLHTHSSEFFVCEILVREVEQGRLKVVRPRTVVRPQTGSRPDDSSMGLSGADHVKAAREQLEAGMLEQSVRHLQTAASLEPHLLSLRKEIVEVELCIRGRLAEEGLSPAAIPVLSIGADELAAIDLEPSEGFVLSRVDGRSTLESIVKISPLAELDALLVIWKLLDGGQLRLEWPVSFRPSGS